LTTPFGSFSIRINRALVFFGFWFVLFVNGKAVKVDHRVLGVVISTIGSGEGVTRGMEDLTLMFFLSL